MKNLLCGFGIHDWEINFFVDKRGKFLHFARVCQRCNKRQQLKRPKKYHPAKWDFYD